MSCPESKTSRSTSIFSFGAFVRIDPEGIDAYLGEIRRCLSPRRGRRRSTTPTRSKKFFAGHPPGTAAVSPTWMPGKWRASFRATDSRFSSSTAGCYNHSNVIVFRSLRLRRAPPFSRSHDRAEIQSAHERAPSAPGERSALPRPRFRRRPCGHAGGGERGGDPAGHDAAVDFTLPTPSLANIERCLARRRPVRVGTPGYGTDDLAALDAPARGAGSSGLRRAELRDRRRPDDAVRDRGGAACRERRRRGSPRHEARRAVGHGDGDRGGMGGDVPIHSSRLPGLVAHQEVIFGGAGQRSRSATTRPPARPSRPAFCLAVERLRRCPPGLTAGLDAPPRRRMAAVLGEVLTAVVTPFREDGSVDLDAFRGSASPGRERLGRPRRRRHDRRGADAHRRGAARAVRGRGRRRRGSRDGGGRHGLVLDRPLRPPDRRRTSSARTGSSSSRRTTTSRRRAGSSSTSRRSPR